MRPPAPVTAAVSLAVEGTPALLRSGLLAPVLPHRAVLAARAIASLGTSAATAAALTAARTPNGLAIVDDAGTLTWRELDDRTARLAAALHAEHGVGTGTQLGVMCRNHRGFVEALLAASRLGADVVLLNTEFPGPQLKQVLAGSTLDVVVHDDELGHRLHDADFAGPLIGDEDREALTARGGPAPGRPRTTSRITILSSGTTGTPKGAARSPSVVAVGGPFVTMLSRLGLRRGEPMLVAPPLFHGLGIGYLALALVVGCPLVLRRRFSPEQVLADLAEHRVATMVAVPVMLRRILDAAPDDGPELHLRAVVSGASALTPHLSERWMDRFGDNLLNLYGSTETGLSGLATPRDLREAPGTVGRPPIGTEVRILGEDRTPVARGEVGHVFVANALLFEGYTGGGSKEVVDGAMNTGDLGHQDEKGRLFIEGREDDMVVSGGENVYPGEVEDVLAAHPAVQDVVVLGVPDEEFGQRLQAHVVLHEGHDATQEDLVAHVKQHLARFKVPREVVFRDELPRNATGKVVKREL